MGGMTPVLGYFRRRPALLKASEERWGRVSCNRVFLNVAIYLAYLFFVPHERSAVDFMLKRALPFVLSTLAVWGIYYGIAGLMRDRNRWWAWGGLTMNAVCLCFHGFQTGYRVLELINAYRFDHGSIKFEYI